MAEFAGEYDEETPVSDEEKMEIARQMLMSSPPGQFIDVLTDLRKLLPEGLLGEEEANAIARAYNHQEGTLIQVGGGGSDGSRCLVLAAEGEADEGRGGGGCVNIEGGNVLEVDHIRAEIKAEGRPLEEGEGFAGGKLEEHRLALEEELEGYRRAHYSSVADRSAACVFAGSGGSPSLVLYVSSSRLNLRNWWSGSWLGRKKRDKSIVCTPDRRLCSD